MSATAKYLVSLREPRIAGFQWQDPEDDHDRKIFRDVLEHGCHIVGIDDAPGQSLYCFSIGFYLNLAHPEFLVMGLDSSVAAQMINHAFSMVEGGHQFSEGERIRDSFPENREGVVKPFLKKFYFAYLGYACWFYRSLMFLPPAIEPKFPVYQIFWPDKEGRYPFDQGCHPAVVRAQAVKRHIKGEL